jgi:hypothetical protein
VPSKQWATGSIPVGGAIILNLNLSNLTLLVVCLYHT